MPASFAVFVVHPFVLGEQVGYGVGLIGGDHFVGDHCRQHPRQGVEVLVGVGFQPRYPVGDGRNLVFGDDSQLRQPAEQGEVVFPGVLVGPQFRQGVRLLFGYDAVGDQFGQQLGDVPVVVLPVVAPAGEPIPQGRELIGGENALLDQPLQLVPEAVAVPGMVFIVPVGSVLVPGGGGLVGAVPVGSVHVGVVFVDSVLVQPDAVFPGVVGLVVAVPVAGDVRLLAGRGRRGRRGVGVAVPVAGRGHHREQGDNGQQTDHHRQYLLHRFSFP